MTARQPLTAEERAALLDGLLAAPFDEAMGSDPSVRLVHELAKVGAVTMEQVLTRSPSDLLHARLPRRCLLELVRLLEARGLRLRDDDGSWR